MAKYSPLVRFGDQLSEKVIIRGTTYRTGYVIITKVYSCDVLQVGTILQVIMRKNAVLFLILLSESVRNKLGFFESLLLDTVDLVQYEKLADFKPIIKRGDNASFPFVLHHHVPAPLGDSRNYFKIMYSTVILIDCSVADPDPDHF
jgi:hypothetical protein